MSTQPDIRTQLRSLSIPKDQRPAAKASPRPARAAGGRGWLKAIVILVAAVVLVEAGYYAFSGSLLTVASLTDGRKAAAADVPLYTVTRRENAGPIEVHTATGKIVSDHKVRVTTKVSGQIVELLFEQGDAVKQGQVLARLESVLPRARRDEAAAALAKAKATLEFQRKNFNRVEDLYKIENAPEIEYADARRAFEEAKAQVDQNQALLDWSEKILRDCEVVAPISGVILERNVEVGDFVAAEGGLGANANAQFGTIADMDVLRVEVDVSEMDIARIRKGMRCRITPDAYKERTFDGHVMWIDPGANYSKATVQVKVRIEKPDSSLRVEGVAQVVFLADDPKTGDENSKSENNLWIPVTACIPAADEKTGRVFVLEEGRLKETTVTLGRKVGNQIEVVNGLSSGQSIVADRIEAFSDGQRVKN